MRRCRIGLVGAGNVAQRHARVLSGFSDVQLVGVTDVAPDAAHRLADQYGCRVFGEVTSLVAAEVDAVYVCVPPFAHGPAEEVVLSAGLPMFVEKPVAVDRDTAERIGALVAKSEALTAVGHHWRYLEVVERARRLLDDRPVRMVSGWWWDKIPPVEWWARRARSGGPIVEQAAHVLDLIRLLAGEASEVTAYGDGRPPALDGADIDSVTTAALRFASGPVGTLSSACVLGWKHCAGVDVVADGLALRVGENELVVREGDREERMACDPDSARTAVDRAFVDAVLGIRNDIRVPYDEALRTHRLACAVAESAAEARTVRLTPEDGDAAAPQRPTRMEVAADV